jgi:hypothetical protein
MKKVKIIALLLFILLIGVVIAINKLINSNPNSYFGKKYLDSKYKSLFWYNAFNLFDIERYGFDKPSTTDAFVVDFSDNDLRYNDSVMKIIKYKNHFSDELKPWRKTNLVYKKKSYSVKYKFHGTDLFIYHNKRMSLKIKSKKYVDGAKKFNLISGLVEGSFVNIFLSQQAKNSGLIGPDPGKTVLANLNGQIEDYWFTQDISEDYLAAKHNLYDYKVFKNSDNWDRNGFGHYSELAKFSYYLDEENANTTEDVSNFKKFQNFFNSLHGNNDNSFKKNIDYNYMGRFLANLYFFYDPHYVYGDNNKFLYDYNKNKVYPVARNEGLYGKVTSILNFDEALYDLRGESPTQTLYKKAVAIDSIKHIRDQELYRLVVNKQKMLNELDSIYNQSYPYHKHYNISFIDIRYTYKKMKELIHFNCSQIEKYLNNGEIAIAYNTQENSITIATDYRVPIKMINALTSKERVFNGVDIRLEEGKLVPKLKENTFKLISNINKGNLFFINTVTKDTIPSKHIIFNHF